MNKKLFTFSLAFLFAVSSFLVLEGNAVANGKGKGKNKDNYKIVVQIKSNKTAKKKDVMVEVSGVDTDGNPVAIDPKTTRKNGIVKFKKLPAGTYTVTPTKEGFSFDPTEHIYTTKNRKSKKLKFKVMIAETSTTTSTTSTTTTTEDTGTSTTTSSTTTTL